MVERPSTSAGDAQVLADGDVFDRSSITTHPGLRCECGARDTVTGRRAVHVRPVTTNYAKPAGRARLMEQSTVGTPNRPGVSKLTSESIRTRTTASENARQSVPLVWTNGMPCQTATR